MLATGFAQFDETPESSSIANIKSVLLKLKSTKLANWTSTLLY